MGGVGWVEARNPTQIMRFYLRCRKNITFPK